MRNSCETPAATAAQALAEYFSAPDFCRRIEAQLELHPSQGIAHTEPDRELSAFWAHAADVARASAQQPALAPLAAPASAVRGISRERLEDSAA